MRRKISINNENNKRIFMNNDNHKYDISMGGEFNSFVRYNINVTSLLTTKWQFFFPSFNGITLDRRWTKNFIS